MELSPSQEQLNTTGRKFMVTWLWNLKVYYGVHKIQPF